MTEAVIVPDLLTVDEARSTPLSHPLRHPLRRFVEVHNLLAGIEQASDVTVDVENPLRLFRRSTVIGAAIAVRKAKARGLKVVHMNMDFRNDGFGPELTGAYSSSRQWDFYPITHPEWEEGINGEDI